MKCKGVGILIILEIFNSFYNEIITQGIHIEIRFTLDPEGPKNVYLGDKRKEMPL